MRVTVRTFEILRELSADRIGLDLADGGSIEDAWTAMAARFPGLQPHRPFVRAAHNGAYADWSRSLADGDEVAFLPPVSGGAVTGLSSQPIDVAALEAALADRGHGAMVTFVGRARSLSDDGRQVLELEYEVYPEMAAGGATLSPLLFSVQLVLAALALGAVNAAMLLGHWYLVTPRLSPTPLRRMMWLLLAALGLQVVTFAVAVLTVSSGPLGGPIGWLTWLRLAVGILLPIGITVLAMLASRAASLQASTGLLYIGLAFVMAGSIAGASITYLTGVPV